MTELTTNPAAIARAGQDRAERLGCGLLDALDACAKQAGVHPLSDEFDVAARLAGLPYCRALDLYVDVETKRRADELGFARAHLAFLC